MSKIFVDIAAIGFMGAFIASIILYPQTWMIWGVRVGLILLIITILLEVFKKD